MKNRLTTLFLTTLLCLGFLVSSEKTTFAEESKNTVELVFVLDESGSMSNLVDDTIGGFNSMLDKEKESNDQVNVTTVLFSNDYKILHYSTDIKEVNKMTKQEYTPGGMTALLDAVGRTIHRVDKLQDKEKDSKVLFVIITDGRENYSKKYTYSQIKKMIEDRQEEADWEFIFLGANIDAAKEAEELGIKKDNAIKYKNTGSGVRANFEAVAEATSTLSRSGKVKDSWKQKIEKDAN